MIPRRCPASTAPPTGPSAAPAPSSERGPASGRAVSPQPTTGGIPRMKAAMANSNRAPAVWGAGLGRGWCPAGLKCPAFGGDHQDLGRAGLGLAVLVYVGGHCGQVLLELAPGIAGRV